MSYNLKLTFLFLSLKGNLNFPGKKSEPMREKDLRADRPEISKPLLISCFVTSNYLRNVIENKTNFQLNAFFGVYV